MTEDKKRAKREREERKAEMKREKARLKAERKEAKEVERRKRREALQELEELPEVEEGQGEALYCGPEFEECVVYAEDTADVDTSGISGSVQKEEEYGREAEVGPDEEVERWFSRLRRSLSKSRRSLVAPLTKAMSRKRFDDDFWEEVEDILVGADVGVDMTMILVERVRERMALGKIKDPEGMLELFREVVADALDVGDRDLNFADDRPSVFMMVGVNGTGKTTTIAKLAHLLLEGHKRVLLAAGDTFRAAGIEQLEVWGERVGVHTVKHKQGADAAAVVHDAVESALARDIDVVIADTAGRLHTKTNLMEELKKIKRVAERDAAVTETFLVIDATTGQNGLIQARRFKEAVEVTGVVLTKLDGTAKGGIVVAIVQDLGIPIKFIGVGEGLEDLYTFDPIEFASALFS
jgi:fused signal recognition particle receptor